MKRFVLIFMVIWFGFSACNKKKKEDPVIPVAEQIIEVHLVPTLDGQAYSLNQVIESSFGYRYFFSDIKLLGTELANGANTLATAFLYNYQATGTLLASTVGNKSNYANLSMNLGVSDPLNHADPSLPANSSPLNISNASDMHWGWNPGYIFVKLEGKVDTIPDGIDNFDHNFVFHLGMDAAFRSIDFSNMTWKVVSETKNKTNLLLQMRTIFDQPSHEIDLRANYTSHSALSQMPLTNLVMDQFKMAIEKE